MNNKEEHWAFCDEVAAAVVINGAVVVNTMMVNARVRESEGLGKRGQMVVENGLEKGVCRVKVVTKYDVQTVIKMMEDVVCFKAVS